jgi:hypothetical protein
MPFSGWLLDAAQRAELLERFPPEWPDVIADHITLGAEADDDLLTEAARAEIVGGINDDEGLQAMVVAIDGSTLRPDGWTFHVTWSLDRGRGRKPAESNAVIAERGWRPLDDPVPIRIRPASF